LLQLRYALFLAADGLSHGGAKGLFASLLIFLAPAREHAVGQAVFPTDLGGTFLSCGDLSHHLQLELAAVGSFLHHPSPSLVSVYDILEKLTSISVRSLGFTPTLFAELLNETLVQATHERIQ
jgi:hypothetical protein